MKKLLLPVVLFSALALSGATVPAVAESPATVEAVQPVTADSGAVLNVDTVTVTTTPAPAPTVEPTATPTVEPVPAAPVTTAPVPAAPAVTATVAPVPAAPVAEPVPATTAPADSYVAPAPSYTCMEDEPCWDCKTMGNGICGNPACKAANKFTVTKDGQCSTAPLGYTDSDVRTEGMEMAAASGRGWIMGGANSQMLRRDGFTYVESPTLPGVVHVFAGGADTITPGSAADTIPCGNLQRGDAQMGVVPTCKK